MVLDGEERRRRSRRIQTGVNRQSERRPPFGCCDQQRWGWNASQIIGPVVELEGHGLVEEKHSVSPQQLNRLFEHTNSLSVSVVNFQRGPLPRKRPTSYLSSRSRGMSAWVTISLEASTRRASLQTLRKQIGLVHRPVQSVLC